MDELAEKKRFTLSTDALAEIRKTFAADRADEAETVAAMKAIHAERGYVLDPHSAVGVAVARKLKHEGASPTVTLATAHPAKFPDAVEAAIGIRPKLPPRLADLLERPERIARLPASSEAVARFVTDQSRAVAGAAA
jgi:threonine synthase